MRFLFVVHKNEEKAEQNSVLFHRLTLKERGLRPNGYFPLMRQPRGTNPKVIPFPKVCGEKDERNEGLATAKKLLLFCVKK
ncbi:MAG: hypothetical protein ACLUJC_07655 [Clostridia bacterium]